MGINELVLRGKNNLIVNKPQMDLFDEVPVVEYGLVDSTKYSFEYKVDDDVDVSMFESDRTFDSDDFINAEFEDSVSERDYSYYSVAVASGVLTGTFSQLKLSEGIIDNIKDWKNKDWEKYITIAAQMAGYNKSDLKGAREFLKNRFVPYVEEQFDQEFQVGIEEWLEKLSNHPSVAGLVFSIFTQFSEETYLFGEKEIVKSHVPEYYAIGRNAAEKIVYGLLYWTFGLAVDVAISKRALLEDMKIPKEVIVLLKELCKLSLFKGISTNYCEAEQLFSKLIKKIFENSNYVDADGCEKAFDLRDAMDTLGAKTFESSMPVLINECIVRGFYVVKKLCVEIKDKGIKNFDELEKIDFQNVIPFNNRLVSRMVLVSSGCFAGINVAGATVKAIFKEGKKSVNFAKTLLTEISVAGVGRFIFACVADSKYWSDDIKIFLQRKRKEKKTREETVDDLVAEEMISNDSFKVLSLTPVQTRALYSLEAIAITKDIEHTANIKEREKKQLWLATWQEQILKGMEINLNDYFVSDERAIYEAINKIEQNEENRRWFYLLSEELVVFKPYYPLGSENDDDFKKLKREKYNYIDDQFARKQTIVNQTEIDSIREAYIKYKGIVSGNTQNKFLAAGVAAVAAVATGGLAFAFAPGIATLIAGEAVVGLHGAALTSASLAFVGGGSLAAGGLGMAGGTAIITGGGALLGVAGSGSASMAAILSQTSSDYWVRQTTKLLVFSKCVLNECMKNTKAIEGLLSEIDSTIVKVEANIKELEDEGCSLDKEAIKNAKACLKYMNRCKGELEKLK